MRIINPYIVFSSLLHLGISRAMVAPSPEGQPYHYSTTEIQNVINKHLMMLFSKLREKDMFSPV